MTVQAEAIAEAAWRSQDAGLGASLAALVFLPWLAFCHAVSATVDAILGAQESWLRWLAGEEQ